MLPLRSFLVVALLLATPCLAAEPEQPEKVAPLFTSNETLEVTITAPFEEIMSVRSVDEELPGTITYQDPEAGEVTLDLDIRTRGRYRQQARVCPFAPLRLNFKKTKGTLFAKSNKLKLVTHCRNGVTRYTQAVLKEHLAYRILNTLTDNSFRVRLMHVNYIDSANGKPVESNYAFLIEHRDQLAKRIGLKASDAEKASVDSLDGAYTNLVSVFQFLIANTDFSPIRGTKGERCCHNTNLFGNGEDLLLSIPYDFDMSGLVSAPHGSPDPRFGLRHVRQRLYRGRCENNEHIEATLEVFRNKRAAIEEVITAQEGLTGSVSKTALKFVGGFYKVIDSPRQVNSDLVDGCV